MTIKHLIIALLTVYTTAITALNLPTEPTRFSIIAHKKAPLKNAVKPLSNCLQVGISYLIKIILDHMLGRN